MRAGVVFVSVILLGSAGLALAQQAAAPAPAQQRLPGYLKEAAPDGFAVLPPEPKEGSDRFAQDRAIFKATRALEGSERWKFALADDALPTANQLANFSCALGVALTPENAPKLTTLLRRAAVDSGRVSNAAKDQFQRKRPFHYDPGNVCIVRSARFDESLDYPSGHTTLGWTVGLILAELAPDRSTPVLVRARAYGESRVVCGVHNASAIEGGRTTASITVAAMHGSAEFRADMDAARTELAALRAGPTNLDAGKCVREAELIAKTPYPQ